MTKKRSPFPVSQRTRVRMEVIPQPAPGTASVLQMTTPNTATLRGHGATDYVCGACGFAVCVGLEPGQVQDLVFTCGACGKYNRVTSPATN